MALIPLAMPSLRSVFALSPPSTPTHSCWQQVGHACSTWMLVSHAHVEFEFLNQRLIDPNAQRCMVRHKQSRMA